MGFRGIIKFFTIRAVEGIVAILLITFMPNLPPDAKYSLSFSLTPVLPFEGPFTLNDKLQSAEIWHKGDFIGPEAFAVYNGELYTTIHGGNVVKLIGDKIVPVVKFGKHCKGFHQEHICGRPLGMQFDKQGGLYVADAYYGIFKVDVKTGKQLQLVSMDQEINGKKPKLPNSVAIASNGDIYWTDSSTEFFLYDGVFDMLADGSGRLIHYDAKTKKNTVLIDKLHFANGIRLATDESFVITTETARCRVYRYYLQGSKKGTYDVFLDGLPGLPDNIQTDGKDGFLIPLVVGRDDDYPPPLNILGPFPLLRKFLSRVLGLTELGFKVIDQIYPCEWAGRAIHYIGHFASVPHSLSSPRQTIIHISNDGVILDTIHSLNGSILGISDAFIFKDMLYMGSPFNDHAARIPLEKVGWGHLALKESDYPSSTATETANAKMAPESRNIPAPTQQPKVTTQPTPKAATPSQPTTPPTQKVTKPIPTAQETSTQVPKVATPTPSQTLKQSPSPPPTKQSPPSTKQTQPPPPGKETPSPLPAKQTPPPPPTKQTAPPPPTKQTSPPAPTKQTPPPPPAPTKQTPPPPPAPTKQTPPPPPAQHTSPPPSVKQTAPPAPTKQTSPPPPTKQTPPPATEQTPPPATEQTPPPPTKQTPPPPPTKQTPPPSPTKQTPPPPPVKQTQPPSPTKQTETPPPPTTQTSPPSPTKQTQPPPPPTTQTSPPPPSPAKQTQPPPPPSTQPPKATTPTQVPKVDTQPSQQLPSPSVKPVPTKPAPSSPKEESSQSQGPKSSTTAKESSTQSTKPSTEPPTVSTTPTTQNQATPKQAPQPVGKKNEL